MKLEIRITINYFHNHLFPHINITNATLTSNYTTNTITTTDTFTNIRQFVSQPVGFITFTSRADAEVARKELQVLEKI